MKHLFLALLLVTSLEVMASCRGDHSHSGRPTTPPSPQNDSSSNSSNESSNNNSKK